MAAGGPTAYAHDRERLRNHFEQENNPEKWDELWRDGSFLPWDRSTSNPALVDILNDRRDILGDPITVDVDGQRRRKKALVPGCGKGYDVFLFAAFGYDAYGLEGSEHAVRACESFRSEANKRKEYEVRDKTIGKGEVRFMRGDFFAESSLAEIGETNFDVVYDYTFLCALPPARRPAWALRMFNLLATDGKLICLEFPTFKDPSAGGPPFALPPLVYEMLFQQPGEDIKYSEDGHVIREDREPSVKSLERIAHWQPERTHEVGKGTDWVGIWQHRGSVCC